MAEETGKLLTVGQACAALRVSRTFLLNVRRASGIGPTERDGPRRLFRSEDVDRLRAWIAAHYPRYSLENGIRRGRAKREEKRRQD